MPRLIPKDAPPQTAPRLVEDTLLVVAPFRDGNGTEYRAGDRVPLGHRTIRLQALAHPEQFRMEFETGEVDLDWLRALDQRHEADYRQAVREREKTKAAREQDLRDELREQERPQPALERRFEQQEKDKKKRRRAAHEEAERQKIEQELALGKPLNVGFHHD